MCPLANVSRCERVIGNARDSSASRNMSPFTKEGHHTVYMLVHLSGFERSAFTSWALDLFRQTSFTRHVKEGLRIRMLGF